MLVYHNNLAPQRLERLFGKRHRPGPVLNFAGGGGIQEAENVQERCLAGPVGTQKRVYTVFFDGQVGDFQNGPVAVDFLSDRLIRRSSYPASSLEKVKQQVHAETEPQQDDAQGHGQGKGAFVVFKGHGRCHGAGKPLDIAAQHHADAHL